MSVVVRGDVCIRDEDSANLRRRLEYQGVCIPGANLADVNSAKLLACGRCQEAYVPGPDLANQSAYQRRCEEEPQVREGGQEVCVLDANQRHLAWTLDRRDKQVCEPDMSRGTASREKRNEPSETSDADSGSKLA